eukprot:Hpha_TRINITY_DN16875_c2_g2::TRINITY_DN16875_c2_g2_i1::g.151257::m.151257/K11254/H4; histone H4
MPKGKAKGGRSSAAKKPAGLSKPKGKGKVKAHHPGKISNGGIRRLARRGGVKRIATGTYEEVRRALHQFVDLVLTDAMALVELKRTKTVTTADVLYALKTTGHALYAVE